MNLDQLAGHWKQFHGLLVERWGRAVGDPHREAAGFRERLAGRRQARTGLAREAGERQFKEFLARNRDWQRTTGLADGDRRTPAGHRPSRPV